ncbi:MAG TPA: lipopolysaccharide transport periplasmic protein LptA [Nitrospirota bacterium]|nr:lipopolysaccharide transport periplasmic protein LptA [Nitrospirota bacterium]
MSWQCCKNDWFIILTVSLLINVADAAPKTETGTREPIVVTSGHMEAEKLGDKVIFTGNVTLKKEDMTLTSEKMVVFYDAKSKEVRQIDAHGNVIVHKDHRVAYANDASYYSRDEKIVLTGDARIVENENRLGGTKITLFMRDDRSLVEGGKVLLYQEKKDLSRDSSKNK